MARNLDGSADFVILIYAMKKYDQIMVQVQSYFEQ